MLIERGFPLILFAFRTVFMGWGVAQAFSLIQPTPPMFDSHSFPLRCSFDMVAFHRIACKDLSRWNPVTWSLDIGSIFHGIPIMDSK